MQLAGPLYQRVPSTLIFASKLSAVQLRGPAEHVGRAAEAVLEVVGALDHRRVEAGPGHHGEALAVEAADVEPAAVAVQRDLHGLRDVALDAEVRGEQVRGPGGDDRERDLGVLERVDAALHHPVAAPGEDQLGAVLQRPLDRARRPLALRHLDPQRLGDARLLERAPQLREPAAERLAGMRDDRQLHAQTRRYRASARE